PLLRDDRLLALFAEREERLLLPVDREARLVADRLLVLLPVARRAPPVLLARAPVARARSGWRLEARVTPRARCSAVSLPISLLKLLFWPLAVSSWTSRARLLSSNF